MTVEHVGGKPIRYTPEQLQTKFEDYLIYCIDNALFANITGFSLFAKMNDTTYYEYKNKQSYSNAIKSVEDGLLDLTIQRATGARNPAFLIFYMKNKFNWTDRQDINTTGETTVHNKIDLTGFTTKQIKDMLAKK